MALLDRARHRLPEPSSQYRQEFEAAMAEYQAMVEHNELEVALDALDHAGSLVKVRGGFWRDLARAAESMHLSAHATRLQMKCVAALRERSKHLG